VQVEFLLRVSKRPVEPQEKEVFGDIKTPSSASVDLKGLRWGEDDPGVWGSSQSDLALRLPPIPHPEDAAVSPLCPSTHGHSSSGAHPPSCSVVSCGDMSLLQPTPLEDRLSSSLPFHLPAQGWGHNRMRSMNI